MALPRKVQVPLRIALQTKQMYRTTSVIIMKRMIRMADYKTIGTYHTTYEYKERGMGYRTLFSLVFIIYNAHYLCRNGFYKLFHLLDLAKEVYFTNVR